MKVLCISASNTVSIKNGSTSTKVCEMIEQIIHDTKPDAITETVALSEYDLQYCRLCGECATDSICRYDKAFNKLYSKITNSDMFFFVVPHYSPIPSKLITVFEKINELAYASWTADNNFSPVYAGKITGVIGHGGMPQSDKVLKHYHDVLCTPVANTLKSLAFKVVGLDDEFVNGTAFGLKDEHCIVEAKDSVFPDIIQDWSLIENKVRPYVEKLIPNI